MNNRNILKRLIKLVDEGYEIGCYSELMNDISQEELIKVIEEIDQEYTDVDIKINGKNYVVEICTVDNEKDFIVLSREEYINRYGNERYL